MHERLYEIPFGGTELGHKMSYSSVYRIAIIRSISLVAWRGRARERTFRNYVNLIIAYVISVARDIALDTKPQPYLAHACARYHACTYWFSGQFR